MANSELLLTTARWQKCQ